MQSRLDALIAMMMIKCSGGGQTGVVVVQLHSSAAMVMGRRWRWAMVWFNYEIEMRILLILVEDIDARNDVIVIGYDDEIWLDS